MNIEPNGKFQKKFINRFVNEYIWGVRENIGVTN